MAAAPAGLTTSIRRKLQEGKTPEDIVRELVAGGMSQPSAQRFVDRALAEDASLPGAPAADSLDPSIQTTAETQSAQSTTGRTLLWSASTLMCSSILINGVWFMRSTPGEPFSVVWWPIAIGFLMWGATVIHGVLNFRTFAWLSAMGSIALPTAFTVLMLGYAAQRQAYLNEIMQSRLADFEASKSSNVRARQEARDKANPPDLSQLLHDLEVTDAPNMCGAVQPFEKVREEERAAAADAIMKHFDSANDRLKICIAYVMITLDPPLATRFFEEWSKGTNGGVLQNSGILGLRKMRYP